MIVRRAAIIAEARTWLGTPYHHGASLKGAGCDCLGLVRGIYRAVLGAEPERPPAYSASWLEASGEEAMLDAARRHLAGVPLATLRPGDVLVFRLRPGFAAKHAAILVAVDRVIHAQEGVSVSEVSLGGWWRRRVAGGFAFPGVVD